MKVVGLYTVGLQYSFSLYNAAFHFSPAVYCRLLSFYFQPSQRTVLLRHRNRQIYLFIDLIISNEYSLVKLLDSPALISSIIISFF